MTRPGMEHAARRDDVSLVDLLPFETRGGPVHPEVARARRRRRRRRRLLALVVVLALVGGGVWAWWKGAIGRIPVREHCTATVDGGTTELRPEQAGNAAVIAATAVHRDLPGRAATIAIATAIQESKLTNIGYGDRDSIGLFQQRPSQGWGSEKELRDPVYATNAFYDVLEKIDGYETMPVTKAAQKVQRSAFPTAYADHEPEARLLASALTGYSPGGLTCVLRGTDGLAPQNPGADGLTGRAQAVSKAAGRETGLKPAGDRADTAGRTVQWSLDGSERGRRGWALAQWAVARAEGLAIVSVRTDGRRWLRDRPDQGWTADPAAVPAGRVVVTVAGGGDS